MLGSIAFQLRLYVLIRMSHRSVGIHKYRSNDLSFVLDFPVVSFIDVCFLPSPDSFITNRTYQGSLILGCGYKRISCSIDKWNVTS